MSVKLNQKITILDTKPIVNSKASEIYVSVRFEYEASQWEGYVPIEYRRTGLSIDFADKDALTEYLNSVYEQMSPKRLANWKKV